MCEGADAEGDGVVASVPDMSVPEADCELSVVVC